MSTFLVEIVENCIPALRVDYGPRPTLDSDFNIYV